MSVSLPPWGQAANPSEGHTPRRCNVKWMDGGDDRGKISLMIPIGKNEATTKWSRAAVEVGEKTLKKTESEEISIAERHSSSMCDLLAPGLLWRFIRDLYRED